MNQQKTTKRRYDFEYSTQFMKEADFLAQNDIHPTFIKNDQYGVRTYKYKKSAKLFRLIADFYESYYNEVEYNAIKERIASSDNLVSPDSRMIFGNIDKLDGGSNA